MIRHLNFILAIVLLLFISSCRKTKETILKEAWIEKPVSEWPDLVMTNTVEFSDTTYRNIGNAFLVHTGSDTLAITCKHIFMIFRNETNNKINLNDNFRSWSIYPKEEVEKSIQLGKLINQNSNEETGEFNTLKSRDWILFKLNKKTEFTPLKIRTRPVSEGEIVYAVGWAYKQYTQNPSLVKMKVYKNMGSYFYINTITENVDPAGRSGSPVIDKNGYLVGIVSGAEGKLGVIGGVSYLSRQLDEYKINSISKNAYES
ncbi:S1 family peptidase [Maribellus maritimus]|uniref:S1 family peptidase n=1 Tax=Maribellus maritimus TaxID=2870838 RepID=UPI001EEB1478|nr:serine protease [Maribellus maritimus]MCG6187070.1 serine protease [Maribellus maritimus]